MGGLRLQDLCVTRADGSVALRDVSLDVAAGELVALVGPSGSGKTTLLRAVAGLVDASGTVSIDGRDVSRVQTSDRELAMVFESGALLSFLDVAHNVGYGLQVRHVPAAERAARVDAEAGRLRLRRFLTRKPGDLSAGERSRADIARALVRRPSAWLFDEALAHLDPGERFQLRHRLVQEVKQQGVASLYVTHDPAEALAVGDRVAVLNGGRLVQVDTPRELYARPRNAFVATFLTPEPVGLLPARIVSAGGAAGFQVAARTLPLWDGLPGEMATHVDDEVVLAFRPEDVRDAAGVDDPDVARLEGRVVTTEFIGAWTTAFVEVEAAPASCPGIEPGSAPATRARLVARLPRDHPVRAGARLTVALDAARAHVFDARTGTALWHPADLERLRPL